MPHRPVQQLLAKCNSMGYNRTQRRWCLLPSREFCGTFVPDSFRMDMRRLFANVLLGGLGLALPLWAFGQAPPAPTSMPVIPPVHVVHAKKDTASTPVWRDKDTTLSVSANGRAGTAVPTAPTISVDGQTHSAGAGFRLITKPGLTAHANVSETRWSPLLPTCANAYPGAAFDTACLGSAGTPVDGMQRGEIGAGFSGRGVQLDLSVGQSQSANAASST